MMYIEDLLCKLDTTVRYSFEVHFSAKDGDVVGSLANNCRTGAGLTFKQRALAVKLLKRYRQEISKVLGQDVSPAIDSPQFKIEVRKPIETRSVTVEEFQGKQMIIARFPYDSNLVGVIHEHKQKYYPILGSEHVQFDFATKSWVFEINDVNVCFMAQLNSLGFTIDPALLPALEQINHVIENLKDHFPHLAAGKRGYHMLNVPDSVPPITTSNLLAALIHARRYGVNDWDDTVQSHIDSDSKVKRIEKFFRSTVLGGLIERHPIDHWVPLLPHCQKVLIVVPGGIELAHTAQLHGILLANGYKSREISVMFRTCNKRKPEFNKYVNQNNLNNSLSDQTRAVMISGSMPKPLVAKDFNFDLVICGGNQYSNQRLRNYLHQQHNAVWVEHQELDK